MKIEEICNKFKISKQTWYNWKKNKPELIKTILKGLEKENIGGITVNGNNNIIAHHNKIMINNKDICLDICETLEKLPENKQKKFYFKIMAELLEEIEKK